MSCNDKYCLKESDRESVGSSGSVETINSKEKRNTQSLLLVSWKNL